MHEEFPIVHSIILPRRTYKNYKSGFFAMDFYWEVSDMKRFFEEVVISLIALKMIALGPKATRAH
jgi:uncharacterized protein (DUF1919 family)